MTCERCLDGNKTAHKFTITKGDAAPANRVLCDDCAQAIKDNTNYKLTGGKAPEAKPSEPVTEVKRK